MRIHAELVCSTNVSMQVDPKRLKFLSSLNEPMGSWPLEISFKLLEPMIFSNLNRKNTLRIRVCHVN